MAAIAAANPTLAGGYTPAASTTSAGGGGNKFCGKCGKQAPADMNFCSKCGSPLA